MMPPSAAPISNRVASMKAKPVASPEPNEQSAKSAVESISSFLRDPNRSATTPTPKAAIAQVNDSPPDKTPTSVLLSPSSGWTKGIKKLSALRSNKTNPKLTLSNAVSRHW